MEKGRAIVISSSENGRVVKKMDRARARPSENVLLDAEHVMVALDSIKVSE